MELPLIILNLVSVAKAFSIFTLTTVVVLQIYIAMVGFLIYIIDIYRVESHRQPFEIIKGFYLRKIKYINHDENKQLKLYNGKVKHIRDVFLFFSIIGACVLGISYVILRLSL